MTHTTPYYQRVSLNLITLCLIAAILYLAQGILLPLFFSALLATLLLPVTNFFQRRKLPKVASILVAILVSLCLIATILYFLSHQVALFLDDADTIKDRISTLFNDLQDWVNQTFNVSERKQNEYLRDASKNLKDSGAGFLGKTFATITESLAYVVFLPVYTFLILYYKDLIKKFFIKAFNGANPAKIEGIMYQSSTIGRQYILGLFIDMTIVFTLNSIGFLILGIQYAIFLALVAAILNLIPYIGMLIANVFSMLITLVSSDQLSDVLWVAIVLAAVQFIDNNFLMPLIVGNKVRINALVTIIGVVVGGTLCGVGGMFLAIPAIAFLKVVFDNVPGLAHWGLILGDDTEGKKSKKKAIV